MHHWDGLDCQGEPAEERKVYIELVLFDSGIAVRMFSGVFIGGQVWSMFQQETIEPLEDCTAFPSIQNYWTSDDCGEPVPDLFVAGYAGQMTFDVP